MKWIPVGDDDTAALMWGEQRYTTGPIQSGWNVAPEPLAPKVILQQPVETEPTGEGQLTINGQPVWPSRFDVLYGPVPFTPFAPTSFDTVQSESTSLEKPELEPGVQLQVTKVVQRPANGIKARRMSEFPSTLPFTAGRTLTLDTTDWRSDPTLLTTRTGWLSSGPNLSTNRVCSWSFPQSCEQPNPPNSSFWPNGYQADSTHYGKMWPTGSLKWYFCGYSQMDCAQRGMFDDKQYLIKRTNRRFRHDWLDMIQAIGRGNRTPLVAETDPTSEPCSIAVPPELYRIYDLFGRVRLVPLKLTPWPR